MRRGLLALLFLSSSCVLYDPFPAFVPEHSEPDLADEQVPDGGNSAEISIEISSPNDDVFTNGVVSIQLAVSGSPDVVELFANDELIVRLNEPYSYDWNTRSLAEGVYVLSSRASGGNVSENRRVVVDRSPPEIVLRSPEPNGVGRFESSVFIEFNEPFSVVSEVEVLLPGGGTFRPQARVEEVRLVWPPNWVDGVVSFRGLEVADLAGNVLQVPTWSVEYPLFLEMPFENPSSNYIWEDFRFDSEGNPEILVISPNSLLVTDPGHRADLDLLKWNGESWVLGFRFSTVSFPERVFRRAKFVDGGIAFSTYNVTPPEARIRFATETEQGGFVVDPGSGDGRFGDFAHSFYDNKHHFFTLGAGESYVTLDEGIWRSESSPGFSSPTSLIAPQFATDGTKLLLGVVNDGNLEFSAKDTPNSPWRLLTNSGLINQLNTQVWLLNDSSPIRLYAVGPNGIAEFTARSDDSWNEVKRNFGPEGTCCVVQRYDDIVFVSSINAAAGLTRTKILDERRLREHEFEESLNFVHYVTNGERVFAVDRISGQNIFDSDDHRITVYELNGNLSKYLE